MLKVCRGGRRNFSLRFTFPVSLFAICLGLLGTVPNKVFASTTWTETQKSDWADGLISNTTWYPTTQLELDKPDWALWMDNNWKYRRKINISNAGASGLSDYQVWIPTTSFTSAQWSDIISKAQSDMDDFRFTFTTATTTIPYWIDTDTNNPTGFWVRVSTIPTTGTSIFMYYGNSEAGTWQSFSNTMIEDYSYESGIIAQFLCNEGENSTLTDSVGAYNGTNTDISWVVGHHGGYAINPTLDTGYVTLPSVPTGTNWSADLWFKYPLANNASYNTLFRAPDAISEHHLLVQRSDMHLGAYVTGFGDSGYVISFLANGWHHLAVVGDGGASTKFYVNGAYVGSTGLQCINVITKLSGIPSQTFGTVDNVKFYNRVLGINEIKAHAKNIKYAATEPTISSVGAEQGKYYSEGNYKANVLNSGADGTKVHQVDWNLSGQAAGTDVNVYVRASNSSFASGDGTPSWTSVSNGGNPALVGRYIQWMGTFTTTSSTTTPRIEDIALTYTSPPSAPMINYNAGDSYTQITWKWEDNSSGQYQEDGFKVYSSTGGILKTLSADVTCWTEAGLKRNTKYGRYVQSHNTAGSNNSVTVNKKTQPCVWQEKTTTRTGPNAFGFEGDGIWTWKVPANGGSLLTITAYAQYNSDYGGVAKPKITLYNYGVNSSEQMTGAADTWEKLTVSGTPTGKGVLFLKVEGFSTAVGAKYFVDDIQVSQ